MKQLTRTKKLFISEYIRTLDPIKAAAYAGFTNTSEQEKAASKFLSTPAVIKGIKTRLKDQIEILNVPKGYVIQKLLQIAEFSLQEEEINDKDGNYTGKRKLRDASAGLKALESLCKYLGFAGAKDEKNYKEAKIITISNLDDKKI